MPSENNGIIYCKESQTQGLTAPGNWVFNYIDEIVPEEPDVPEEPTRPLYSELQFAGNKEITMVDVMVNSSHTGLGNMFNGCTNLISVNTEGWDTSNVTIMMNMFNGCQSLTELDLSSLNTGKVTNMSWMFYNCSRLVTLDICNFDMSNITTIRDIFSGCTSLHTLRLDNCSADTVSKLITTSSFPVDNIGVIYCSRIAADELEAPGNWSFSYIY